MVPKLWVFENYSKLFNIPPSAAILDFQNAKKMQYLNSFLVKFYKNWYMTIFWGAESNLEE